MMNQNLHNLIKKHIRQSMAVKEKIFSESASTLIQIAQTFQKALTNKHTIYLCGNGGSAADAQHVAAELVGRFLKERSALPAVALTTNTSILTALANDYSFDVIFARQVEACVGEEDILVGISTSGKSTNVIQAVEVAKTFGAWTLGFTGSPGEPLADKTDLCLKIPSSHTPYIQEAQIMCWHIICDLVEQNMVDCFKKNSDLPQVQGGYEL